jgi:SagB-type dehydrogenase family enzyme
MPQLATLLGVVGRTPTGMPYGSAGALYPAHPFVLRPAGPEAEVWYLDTDALEAVPVAKVDDALIRSALTDKWAWPVGALVVVALDFRRICEKYGPRGLRFATIEAGQLAQLICVRAREMDLRSCIVGGYGDELMLRVLALDEQWFGVAMAIAIGQKPVKISEDGF